MVLTGASIEIPVALPEMSLSSMTAAIWPLVVSSLMPLLALLRTLELVMTTCTLPPTPGAITMPPPVAALPLSATVALLMNNRRAARRRPRCRRCWRR